MSESFLHKFIKFLPTASITVSVVLLSIGIPATHGESEDPSHLIRNTLKLGEGMYREGVLPTGEPLPARVKGDSPVPGTSFACVSCHMRGGFGSVEAGVLTPPISGKVLFKPVNVPYRGREQKFSPEPLLRPAYTEKSLAEVIRSGKNPAGAFLNDIMPRYILGNEEMEILVSYLKSLSVKFSPGISDTAIHFATVMTDDVPPDVRKTMFDNLHHYISIRNLQAQASQKPPERKSRLMSRTQVESTLVTKYLATRQLVLSQWLLKGSPETWRSQLDEYYRKEPVFALLGGISNQEWQTIHEFSEKNMIPCLLPQTDFPIISTTDWYTIYPSKGYYQEGETAARFLDSRENMPADRPIVQIVRESPEGTALSAGFEDTWRDLERGAVVTVRLKIGDTLTKAFMERLLAEEQPAALVLWDGPELLPALEFISSDRRRPELFVVSSRYLGTNIMSLPEQARPFTYITYPFTYAQKTISTPMGKISVEDDSKWSISLSEFGNRDSSSNAAHMSGSITQLLTMALLEMRGDYYRDNFLDAISMVPDQPSALYGRLSFGPGQRYASKGCYIVQVTNGLKPEIVRKSAWLIN